jgi:F-type H+-transporting ATPase subunit gamma
MGKTREIKKRIKAVGNIRRITKTMQMIATSKFARAQQKAVATKPYTEGVFELVREIAGNLASGGSDVTHPLISGPASGAQVGGAAAKPLTLIITSDRGLAGPYNGSVLRNAMAHLRSHAGAREGEIEVIGRKGANFLRFNQVPIAKQHAIGDKADYRDVERIAQSYIDRFARGEISSVHVVYMKFFSAGRQRPTVMQLLPLQPPTENAPAAGEPKVAVDYEFSPPAEELLNTLLPASVKSTLMQAINDAIVSEHIARMVAMKSATDNAGKMGKRLTRQYNRARQAQITTELTEIISGAAALD